MYVTVDVFCAFLSVCWIVLLLRLEPDNLWCHSSPRKGTSGHDSTHRSPAPLSAIRLFLRPGCRVCSCHVLCRLLHPFGKLHVCEEHLPARLQTVGEYTCVFLFWHLSLWAFFTWRHNHFAAPLCFHRHLIGRLCGWCASLSLCSAALPQWWRSWLGQFTASGTWAQTWSTSSSSLSCSACSSSKAPTRTVRWLATCLACCCV